MAKTGDLFQIRKTAKLLERYRFKMPGLSGYAFDEEGVCLSLKTYKPMQIHRHAAKGPQKYLLIDDRGDIVAVRIAEAKKYVLHLMAVEQGKFFNTTNEYVVYRQVYRPAHKKG